MAGNDKKEANAVEKSSRHPSHPEHDVKNDLYTCPMHPEVLQSGPGACPICGMSLEPKNIIAGERINEEYDDINNRFKVSLYLTIPILILNMGLDIPGLASLFSLIPPDLSNWLRFFLATPVVFGCGWPLLQRGWASLINRRLNMFTLIALGTLVAYSYSVVAILFPVLIPPDFLNANGSVNLYFDVAAAITVLVLLGQVLELRGRLNTTSALRALLELAPKIAFRVTPEGDEEISLDAVQVNDSLRIHPGEKVPVDGKIIEGHSVIDESMITGEYIPVEKAVGSTVIGGTMNISGSFIMRAERIGNETMLAQIVQQVSIAQRSRAPIQHLVDEVAGYFVPAVILLAIVTFCIWTAFGPAPSMAYGLISAISVLIIACPCALGLATPMSIMVGMGRAAQVGILIKNAESLERLEKVNALVIDKTGTLTVGKPIVNKIVPDHDFTETGILSLAASLELNSEHPMAGAIIDAAQERTIHLQKATEFVAFPGKGISGVIDNKHIILGNINILEEFNLQAKHWIEKVEELSSEGGTVMFVVVDKHIAGLISVSDKLKENTQPALDALRALGMHLVMVTGDNRLTALSVARKLHIDDIEAEVLPAGKIEIVRHLHDRGYVVAMAGDGINDAAALASADIGIAMGTGTDIAIKSASITLVHGDLMGIVRAHKLSKCVMRNIRQNLFLAFVYNLLCIPLAAGLLYPFTGTLLNPIFAAAAMSLSSVSVIANAYRLRKVQL
jgi:Cu+-exporting ATPase